MLYDSSLLSVLSPTSPAALPTHCTSLPIFLGQGPPFMKSDTKSVVLHFATAAGQQAPGFCVHSGAFSPLFALASRRYRQMILDQIF